MANSTTATYDLHRRSFFSALYSLQAVLPGLLAMLHIAIFSNNLPGVPNPFTLANLFHWLDGVIGPLNHQPFFQLYFHIPLFYTYLQRETHRIGLLDDRQIDQV